MAKAMLVVRCVCTDVALLALAALAAEWPVRLCGARHRGVMAGLSIGRAVVFMACTALCGSLCCHQAACSYCLPTFPLPGCPCTPPQDHHHRPRAAAGLFGGGCTVGDCGAHAALCGGEGGREARLAGRLPRAMKIGTEARTEGHNTTCRTEHRSLPHLTLTRRSSRVSPPATFHARCCTAHLQGDVLDRAAYEKAAVAKAHAVILGSLQCPDAKAADARMLTRWAGC